MARKRGKGAGAVLPKGLSRTERKGEAGFVTYCKCDRYAQQHPEVLETESWRRGTCRVCGGFKREWRCPKHFLLAIPLGEDSDTAGCPQCGTPPREQTHDAYATKKAKNG